jgi:hypothetical protein
MAEFVNESVKGRQLLVVVFSRDGEKFRLEGLPSSEDARKLRNRD